MIIAENIIFSVIFMSVSHACNMCILCIYLHMITYAYIYIYHIYIYILVLMQTFVSAPLLIKVSINSVDIGGTFLGRT